MKKMIYMLLGILVLTGFHVPAREDSAMTNQLEYLEKSVTTKDLLPLKARLMQVSEQSAIPVCLESVKSQRPDASKEFAIGKGKAITIKDLKLSLEELGYEFRTDRKSMLVSTPAVKKLEENPLDTSLDGFSFEGDHRAFVEKLSSVFPGLPPNVTRVSGSTREDEHYKVDIEGKVSIRDVLMYVSAQYGIVWHAEISSTPPVYKVEGPDGSAVQAQGSSVNLTFQSIREVKRVSPKAPIKAGIE